MSTHKEVSARIIILNYNGKKLLPKCLPSIMDAAEHSMHRVGVTLLHNPGNPNESGLEYAKETFPNLEIWKSPENKVLCSYNDYLNLVSDEIVILLNNDIRVARDFIDPLIDEFRNPETFMAAPKVMDFEGKQVEAGPSRSGIKWGLFWCDARYQGYEKDVDTMMETSSSGFGAFSRKKFLTLGGYRDWYHPGIMEDVDLCYRARKAGYRLIYVPKSICYHMGQASFKQEFGSEKVSLIAHRNNFIFMWKNLKGISFWGPHLFWLPARLFFSVVRGKLNLIRGFFQALKTIKNKK